ncbi:hypothetical protein J6590_034317 [Homalodisca vitripennis]|nr:hypothetical protein J6590_034317 [Homalodisca vitripennis]
MSANCSICNLVCDDEKSCIKCVGKCSAVIHINCVPSKTRSKLEWMCDVCRLEKESVSSKKSSSTVITKDFLISTMNSFKNEVFSELQTYSKEFKDFKSSLEFFSGKMDNASELINKITEEMKSAKEEARLLREENSQVVHGRGGPGDENERHGTVFADL